MAGFYYVWRIQKDCNSHHLRGGPLSPAARTLGSNIHVTRGLIKNAAQGDVLY